MNIDELREYIDKNLLTKREAIEVTKQSISAFNQAVITGKLKPFYDHGEERSRVRLYLRSEVEGYARKAEERRKRVKK